jgi:long-chain acyl-CoA synthetase
MSDSTGVPALTNDKEVVAYTKIISQPPPPGSPYGLPVPGSERPNRTAAYRHYRFQNIPLLEVLNPSIRTLHDVFEDVATRKPKADCLGHRPWNPVTRKWEDRYEWQSFAQVAERRKNLGAGIVELHRKVGVTAMKYGVGLWSQNRPEWAITGVLLVPSNPTLAQLTKS